MAEPRPLILADPAATAACGQQLAVALLAVRPAQFMIFLEGELGAGKTTLVRGFLEALGHRGRVPSPTYTLIEPYTLSGYSVYHVDLYRIREVRELDDLGLAEQFIEGAVALIEWPDHGQGHLPPADLNLHLEWVAAGRALTSSAASESGRLVTAAFRQC